MSTTKKQVGIAIAILIGTLIADQLIKILVKTHMCLGDSIPVFGEWFYIRFIENNGMAFGMEFIGKTFLTLFRIVAVILIGYYLYKEIKRGARTGYVVCLSFVLAGAIGNIIDCLFYGLLFSESLPYTFWNQTPASFVPFGTGYSTWLHGKVVDMFYFPLIETTWPQWMPFVGGQPFVFFNAIFNLADAAISCGIIALILFFRKDLGRTFSEEKEKDTPSSTSSTTPSAPI